MCEFDVVGSCGHEGKQCRHTAGDAYVPSDFAFENHRAGIHDVEPVEYVCNIVIIMLVTGFDAVVVEQGASWCWLCLFHSKEWPSVSYFGAGGGNGGC